MSQNLFGRQSIFHALWYILVNIGQLETQTNSQCQKSQTTQKGCEGGGLYIFLKPNININKYQSRNSQWLTGGRALLHCTVLGATRRTVSKKLQNYCKNIAKILQKYCKHISKIFPKYSWNNPTYGVQKYFKVIPKTFLQIIHHNLICSCHKK